MFAESEKGKEIWIGVSPFPDVNGDPRIEITWGRKSGNNVNITFEMFIDDLLGAHEMGGPNSGGCYDDMVFDVLLRMTGIIKKAKEHAKKRNEVSPRGKPGRAGQRQ